VAIRLSACVYRIPTLGNYLNSFALLEDDGSVTLVDCGLKRAPGAIVRGLAALGRRPSDVQRIVLTHAHDDHAGGAAQMVEHTAASGVTAHVAEVEYVRNGSRPPIPRTLLSRLRSGGFAPVPVVGELHDGQILDIAGGVQVLHTPGHTPGHVSLLHIDSGVLITGDSIFNMNARMRWPIAAFCTNAVQNEQTAARLADADYTTAAFTHGPHIAHTGREAIRSFLRRQGAL
jgi:glyoxylase-like metal-dependent hydrolase (beta-lactamase superfamily II)